MAVQVSVRETSQGLKINSIFQKDSTKELTLPWDVQEELSEELKSSNGINIAEEVKTLIREKIEVSETELDCLIELYKKG